MFKKHKYKFLVLILLVLVGGGTAYYFKKKAATKKAAEIEEKEAPKEQPKEPIEVPASSEKPKTDAKTKELIVSKGDKQLLSKTK